ncbi:MAG: hypothetical protein ACO1OB_19090 [Archangium sp.]
MRAFIVVLAVVFVGCPSKTVVDAGAPVAEVKEAPLVPLKINEAIEVTLLPRAEFTAGGPMEFQLRVRNTGTAPQKFCTYHTLFEGLRNDVLDVKSADGRELEYRGMMARRAPPGPEDFVTLEPGDERTSEPVDVSEGYAFTAGKFTVVFPGGGISGLPASAPVSIEVK